MYDVIILTESQYINPTEDSLYIKNVLNEDQLLIDACNNIGLKTIKKAWDDDSFDWSTTKCIVFRTTWDYFHRFEEFSAWLKNVESKTQLINSAKLIHWNVDKNYLGELSAKGVAIAPTLFVKAGERSTLQDLYNEFGYSEVILKPCISGAARHTYKINASNVNEFESVFSELISKEDMMLQEFQAQIETKDEVSLMLLDGKYAQAGVPRAKKGDFRVQDDWGGTLESFEPSSKEIDFAEKALAACFELPVYARVDIMWSENNEPLLAELELMEPEVWFRRDNLASHKMANAIKNKLG